MSIVCLGYACTRPKGSIEVKSASYKSHVSLDAFCEKFSSRIGHRYVVYTKDLRHDGEMTLLPIYMIGSI